MTIFDELAKQKQENTENKQQAAMRKQEEREVRKKLCALEFAAVMDELAPQFASACLKNKIKCNVTVSTLGRLLEKKLPGDLGDALQNDAWGPFFHDYAIAEDGSWYGFERTIGFFGNDKHTFKLRYVNEFTAWGDEPSEVRSKVESALANFLK
jgi:translation initiation factor 1 (eIF-1/SUI1)